MIALLMRPYVPKKPPNLRQSDGQTSEHLLQAAATATPFIFNS